MPSAEEIASQKERLYESSSLRDDLNDSEATILLKWGEVQIERLATDFPEDYEKQARFMRQLLKGINRFVGQREFNDIEGQRKYLKKVVMYLEPLGWSGIEAEDILSVLPEDKADMATNLARLLELLSPEETSEDAPIEEVPPEAENAPTNMETIVGGFVENVLQPLENTNLHSITQSDDNHLSGAETDYGEEETE